MDGEEVFHALEGAAFFAELNDGFRGGRADPRQFLELLQRRCVQINRMRRRLFLCVYGAGENAKQN